MRMRHLQFADIPHTATLEAVESDIVTDQPQHEPLRAEPDHVAGHDTFLERPSESHELSAPNRSFELS